MGWFIEIIDAHNGQRLAQFDYSEPLYWRLALDVMIPLEFDTAWCHRCEDFVKSERLPTVEEIDSELARTETVNANADAQVRNRRRWQTAREWRLSRQSPPRCLECGSATGVVPLDAASSFHPGNPKRPITVGVGHYSEVHVQGPDDESRICFDGEGNRLSDVAT